MKKPLVCLLLIAMNIVIICSAEAVKWRCPECGIYDNSGNYCVNCGLHRPVPWICNNCGCRDNYYVFCPQCGTRRSDVLSNISTSIEVGDIFLFGAYDQDYNYSNGKEAIEWIILDKTFDGKVLLLSKYVLASKPYNTGSVFDVNDSSWEKCTLRTWLNNDFFNNAFSETEQAIISTTHVINEANSANGTDGGSDTEDKVFLLSAEEAYVYFTSNKDRLCSATRQAIAQGVDLYENNNIDDGKCASWWLRSVGHEKYLALIVSCTSTNNGRITDMNNWYTGFGVRPAIWIRVL